MSEIAFALCTGAAFLHARTSNSLDGSSACRPRHRGHANTRTTATLLVCTLYLHLVLSSLLSVASLQGEAHERASTTKAKRSIRVTRRDMRVTASAYACGSRELGVRSTDGGGITGAV